MEKLTLKEAKEKATKITGNIPTIGTLRNWVNKGLISSPVDYINRGKAGGRIGLYPGSLPVEIAVAIDLKNKDFEIKEIAEVRKEIIEDLRLEEKNQMETKINLEKLIQDLNSLKKIPESYGVKAKEITNEINNDINLIVIKAEYGKKYKEFSQELKEVEGVKQ